MNSIPLEISLDILPKSRLDVIDITGEIAKKIYDQMRLYKKACYCSFHTTAGYLEQSLCSRLQYNTDNIKSFIISFQKLFPRGADYSHDKIELRTELNENERLLEPKNADSHLTYMGSGLRNCVTYKNSPKFPVFFIDLDGVHEFGRRKRKTRAMFYNKEEVVYKHRVKVPVSNHPIDSINLRDQKLGYLEKLNSLFEKYEIRQGRVDISLDPSERNAGLTVNEYETLLMQYDLVQVLKNPLKFFSQKGKYIIQNPAELPYRAKEYAKYDFVHIFNELMDVFHITESKLEHILSKFIALPASRFLRMRRRVSLLISNNQTDRIAKIIHGVYQSPILIQWESTKNQTRNVELTITRFK
jgi:thiamine phosphate synthase YjbQ (UPF0047 family)